VTVTFTAETLLSESFGSYTDAQARSRVLCDRLLGKGWKRVGLASSAQAMKG